MTPCRGDGDLCFDYRSKDRAVSGIRTAHTFHSTTGFLTPSTPKGTGSFTVRSCLEGPSSPSVAHLGRHQAAHRRLRRVEAGHGTVVEAELMYQR